MQCRGKLKNTAQTGNIRFRILKIRKGILKMQEVTPFHLYSLWLCRAVNSSQQQSTKRTEISDHNFLFLLLGIYLQI